MSIDGSNTTGTSLRSSDLLVDETKNHAGNDSVIQSEALVTFVDENASDDELCTGECDELFATDAYYKHGKHTRMNKARQKAGKRGHFEHHQNLHTVFDLALSAVKRKAAGNIMPVAALAVYESKTAYDRKNPDSGRSWLQQLPVLKPTCARHKQGFLELLGIVEVLINEHKLLNPHDKMISVFLDLKRDFKEAVKPETKPKSSRKGSKKSRSGLLQREMNKFEAKQKKEAAKERQTKQENENEEFKQKLANFSKQLADQMRVGMRTAKFTDENQKRVEQVILPTILRRFFGRRSILSKEDAEYDGVWENVEELLKNRKTIILKFAKEFFANVTLSPSKYVYESGCHEAYRELETKFNDMFALYLKTLTADMEQTRKLDLMKRRHAEEKAALQAKFKELSERQREEREYMSKFKARREESYANSSAEYQAIADQLREDISNGVVDPLQDADDYPMGFNAPPPPPNAGPGGQPPAGFDAGASPDTPQFSGLRRIGKRQVDEGEPDRRVAVRTQLGLEYNDEISGDEFVDDLD